MSVQVRRRREAASFLSTYVGAQGELLVDTTNNRIQVHDGATPGGWPAARLADVIGRTAVADTSYTALATDRTIAFTTLTASRTVTLPAAAVFSTGTQLLVVDESGACSFTTTITVARTGSDTIDGAGSATIATPFGFLAFMSNGVGKWTIVDFTGATAAQLTNRNAIINGNFAINQRAYASGTSLTAGTYAHDRWKAGSGGCTYTFTQSVPDTIATITAGTLVQAVEGANVYAATCWLSWTGTAQARVWQGTASGSYASSPILVAGLTLGSVANVEFSTGTLGLVQFEAALPNAGPTTFERRQIAAERVLCQRYYVSYVFATAGTIQFNTYYTGGSYIGFYFPFAAPMRAQPTVGFIGTWTSFNVTTFGISPVGTQIAEPYLQVTSTGAAGIGNPANGGFSASAEL